MIINDVKEFNQHLQDCAINLLIYNDKFLIMSIETLKSSLFSSTVSADICDICYDFHDKYGSTVGDHLLQEIDTFCKTYRINDDEKDLYYKYTNKVLKLEPNEEYVLKQLSSAIKHQAIKKAFLDGAKLIKQKDLQAAEDLMMKAFNTGIKQYEIGTSYGESKSIKTKQDRLVLPTLIPELDSSRALKGGLKRKMFSIWLAPSSVGKSWALCYLAKCCVVLGVKCVYITIGDDDEAGIESRINASLVGAQFDNNNDITIKDFDQNEFTVEARDNSDLKRHLRKIKKTYLGYDKKKGRRADVMIKEYNSGCCSPEDIDNHLTQLDIKYGFQPDVLLVDYLDEVTPRNPTKDIRQDQLDSINKLKAIASTRNLHLSTAAQSNRSSIDANIVNAKHFSEDIRRWQRSDIVLSLCQTEEEFARNVMRIYGVKNRHGFKNFHIEILTAYSIGQFVLESRWVDNQGQ